MANNNYPQITTITSEALQAQIRNLLPSQEGFGTDLMAQNVIVPIIDLTQAAEGSVLPLEMQQAVTLTDVTSFDITNTTTTLMNSTGFWLLQFYAYTIRDDACNINLTNGITTKQIFRVGTGSGVTGSLDGDSTYKMIILLKAGESASATCTSLARIAGTYRQIADINGNLINPSGYTPQ